MNWKITCWLVFLIEWLQNALSNIKPEDKKEDIIFAKEIYKQALTQHDHYLDKRGPLSGEHRTFTIPFNKKLRKKKKYKKITEKKVKKHQNLLPLFEHNKETSPNTRHLQWNFMAICAGDPKSSWRSPVYNVKLFCRYVKTNHMYMQDCTFCLQVKNQGCILLWVTKTSFCQS